MRLRQREQMERRSKYHFQRLRPEIYRIQENKLPCKKDCDCKNCKKYYVALQEAAAAFQKEQLKLNENNSNSVIFIANKVNRPTRFSSDKNVSAGTNQAANEERSNISNSGDRIESIAAQPA